MEFLRKRFTSVIYFLLNKNLDNASDKHLAFLGMISLPITLLAFSLLIYNFSINFFVSLIIFTLLGIAIITQLRYVNALKNQKAILVEQNELLMQHKILLEQQAAEIEQKNEGLIVAEKRLIAINAELENFAYVASHDLKEPLRMVGMYTQIIQKKLNSTADAATKEYMGYITEGVGRMQNLLNDLLQYSRLGTRREEAAPVNLNNILELVIHNLTVNMTQNDASIIASPLPVVRATSVEMTQLFQNLIANAIKFRHKEQAPVVDIRAFEKENHYLFTFTDNGIGIEPQYHEKVFKIFERLHPRTQYDGSGIGLATCKKIVQNNGGDIWLESIDGNGTTFFLTLPKIEQQAISHKLQASSY
jgi:light-regulated signal transduction histidine kinase (bacteriophytochrome)